MPDVPGGALLDGRRVLEPLQPEHRLVVAEQVDELPVAGGGAAYRVRDEDRPPGAGRLQRPDGLPRRLLVRGPDVLGDVLRRRDLEQLAARDVTAQLGGDEGDDLVGLMVLAAELGEEVGRDADAVEAEHVLEDPDREPLGGVPWHDISGLGVRNGCGRRGVGETEFTGRPLLEHVHARALQQHRRGDGQPEVVLDTALDPDRDERVEAEVGERHRRVEALRVEPEHRRDPVPDLRGDQLPGSVGGKVLERLDTGPVARVVAPGLVRRLRQRREVRHVADLGEQPDRRGRVEAQHTRCGQLVDEQCLQRLRTLRRADRVDDGDRSVGGSPTCDQVPQLMVIPGRPFARRWAISASIAAFAAA